MTTTNRTPPTRAARRRARRRRARDAGGWQPWVALALIAALVLGGTAIQWARSSSGRVVTPARALGPGGSELLGTPGAPVLVEEYADFQCPACRTYAQEVGPALRRLAERGEIRLAFHHFAFLGPESVRAAAAATCAGDEGRFWALHDLLFERQAPEGSGALTEDRLVRLGQEVGLASDRYERCVRGGTYEPWVRQVTEAASRQGITATPTFVVNGERVPTGSMTPQGVLAAVKDAVARARAG